MASSTIYPPLVDSIAPAFLASGDSAFCRLYFSLSKFSSSASQIKSIHISVVKQTTGQSVVKRTDGDNRYRATGIIIVNTSPTKVEDVDNLYYIDIINDDIQSGSYSGWCPSWIYKMQIRLSTVAYSGTIGQSAWLNTNANNFSEWSIYCTTKAIAEPTIEIPLLKGFNSKNAAGSSNEDKEYSLSISTLEFDGTYTPDQDLDPGESLYSYKVQLLSADGELLESSDVIYTNQYYENSKIHYIFKYELKDGESYKIRFEYTTINKYHYLFKDFNIVINQIVTEETTISAITIDTIDNIDNENFKKQFKEQTSLPTEQEEGRIGIKFYSTNTNPYNGNICLRRSDSRDNFNTWTDIKIVVCVNTIINDLDMVFDYTVESGIWYKYGVQTIDTTGERGIMNPMNSSILREWDYSYLLGEGGKQLKLMFNNNMNSYTYNYLESKTDTIGGKYPFITRNGNTEYRTFPINGLISFNMDDMELFTNDKELYTYNEIVNAYRARRRKEHLDYYDYRREYDFREKVLEFLQDGKPKLFKSATEGNIVVRLMQVAGQPNQSLNRMIYSFTSIAHEIADATMENYLKYRFYEVGNYSTSFEFYSTRIGQLDLDFRVGDNIIEKIWSLYDHSDQNIAGMRQTLQKVHHMTLEFTDKPLRIYNNANEEVLGNNFLYNGTKFTVRAGYSRIYVFDENIVFTKGSNLTVLGGIDDIYDINGNIVNTIHITVDFLYEIGEEPYVEKEIDTRTTSKGIGQVYNSFKPGTDIYKEIYYKFYYEWRKEFRRLSRVTWTCLEANPGTIFSIQDSTDDTTGDPKSMYHEINWTGVLNLENLGTIKDVKYVGVRNPDGSIDKTRNVDVIIDYIYYTLEGTYKEEI